MFKLYSIYILIEVIYNHIKHISDSYKMPPQRV